MGIVRKYEVFLIIAICSGGGGGGLWYYRICRQSDAFLYRETKDVRKVHFDVVIIRGAGFGDCT